MPVAHVLLTEAQVEGVEQRVVFEFHRRALGLERVLVRGRADDDSAQAAELPAHGVERGVGGQEGDNKQGGKAREAREGFHGKRGGAHFSLVDERGKGCRVHLRLPS